MDMLIFFIIVWVLLLIFGIIRNEIVYKNHMKIVEAVYYYRLYCIDHREKYEVSYDDLEDYNKTFWRFWDWDYKHILPKEKYKIVEPFIGMEEEK